MVLETLSELLSENRSFALVVIILFIVVQFFFINLMVLYTIFYRILEKHRQAVQQQKNDMWYEYLFDYLDWQLTPDEFKKKVSFKDYPFFIVFIKDYFLDLAGDEKDRLRQLFVYLGIDLYFMNQLSHRNPWKRIYAVYFLGLMNCYKAVVKLREKIYDKSDMVRIAAASNLMQLRDLDSLSAILEHLNQNSSGESHIQTTAILMEFGPEILPHLERIFREMDLKDWLRRVCVDIFGYYVYNNVVDILLELFETTENMELKIACIGALGQFEDPELTDFFEKSLGQSHQAVRVYAAEALGKLGMERSISMLVESAQCKDFWVAKRSIEALRLCGEKGTVKLESILASTQSQMIKELILETL